MNSDLHSDVPLSAYRAPSGRKGSVLRHGWGPRPPARPGVLPAHRIRPITPVAAARGARVSSTGHGPPDGPGYRPGQG